MNGEELQKWLAEHADEISAFTEYEAIPGTEETSWFRDPRWNEPGYRFLSLGQDGTGGEFALWFRVQESSASGVVFFGSEGGSGVLAPSARAFAQALAYAPVIVECARGDLEAPSRLGREDNWYFSGEEPARTAAAERALTNYRTAVEERFGRLPPFEELTAVSRDLQDEFRAWTRAVQGRVGERDHREREHATREKLLALRSKASVYAARSSGRLPAAVSSLAEGTRFDGTCSSCGAHTTCRITRFEDLTFGLCVDCYFSNAW